MQNLTSLFWPFAYCWDNEKKLPKTPRRYTVSNLRPGVSRTIFTFVEKGNGIILSNIAKNTGPRTPRLDFNLTTATNQWNRWQKYPCPSVLRFLPFIKWSDWFCNAPAFLGKALGSKAQGRDWAPERLHSLLYNLEFPLFHLDKRDALPKIVWNHWTK